MSSRTSTLTMLAVACAFILAVTLLVILQKSQRALDISQVRLHKAENGFGNLKKQYEALHDYKDRLEKSFMTFKTEKASQYFPDRVGEMELNLAHARQLQVLQDELNECRAQKDAVEKRQSNTLPANNRKGMEINPPSHQVPITSSPSASNHQGVGGSGDLKSSMASAAALAEELKQHLNGNGMKDAGIQSPIGHVPPAPALPSGDPNEDTAGNVLI